MFSLPMPKQMSAEQKLGEIRRLWRVLPNAERKQFLKSSAPRLSDDLLLEVLAIETLTSFLDGCLELPAVEVSNE